MEGQVVYVFLDTRTEDATVTLDPMNHQGVEDWEQIGEVHTMSELMWLLEDSLFDFEYFKELMEEMPRDIYNLLNKE